MKKKNIKEVKRIKSGRLIFAALIAVFLIMGIIAAYNLITTELDNNAAQSEYAELRQWAPVAASPPSANNNTGTSDTTLRNQHLLTRRRGADFQNL